MISLLDLTIHDSWKEFLTEERIQQLEEIESSMGSDFTPSKDRILRFLASDLYQKKVIWLGQDPYFQPGVANGRSFQPANLLSWGDKYRQVSLKNILRLVHASYSGVTTYEGIKTYKEVLREINDGTFQVKQPLEWFDSLENQGVLFLNTSFSCIINKPNSHKDMWKNFSKKLLEYISYKRPDMIWFLWGKEAISNKEHIHNGVFFESRHPMMCSVKYEDDFLKSPCFKETKDIINWLG